MSSIHCSILLKQGVSECLFFITFWAQSDVWYWKKKRIMQWLIIVKLIAHKKGIQLKIQYPDPIQENLIYTLLMVTALQHHAINIGSLEINSKFLNNKPSKVRRWRENRNQLPLATLSTQRGCLKKQLNCGECMFWARKIKNKRRTITYSWRRPAGRPRGASINTPLLPRRPPTGPEISQRSALMATRTINRKCPGAH